MLQFANAHLTDNEDVINALEYFIELFRSLPASQPTINKYIYGEHLQKFMKRQLNLDFSTFKQSEIFYNKVTLGSFEADWIPTYFIVLACTTFDSNRTFTSSFAAELSDLCP